MMAEYEAKIPMFRTECQQQTSQEEESRNSDGKKRRISDTADGSSIEIARKPRGRPPGSKNKPRPPVIITRDSENAMSPHVLEVPGGCDVVETVGQFARRRQVGLCIINGTGTVSNVTLRQPATPGAPVTFHGRFDILSLSATYLPLGNGGSGSFSSAGFTISLAGAQGHVVGGSVVGALVAAGTVIVVAASFVSPSYHRLPVEEEASGEQWNQTQVSSGGNPPVSSAVGGGGSDSCAMSIYSASANPLSCHLPSDVIWAPTAIRPPY